MRQPKNASAPQASIIWDAAGLTVAERSEAADSTERAAVSSARTPLYQAMTLDVAVAFANKKKQ